MKTFLATVLAAVMLTALAPAQVAGPGGGFTPAQGGAKAGGKRGGGMMFVQKALMKLNLTADQKSKLKVIADKQRADMKELRDAPGDRKEKGPKMREMMKSTTEKIEAALTPSQRESFKTALKEEREKAMAERKAGGGRRGGKTPPPTN